MPQKSKNTPSRRSRALKKGSHRSSARAALRSLHNEPLFMQAAAIDGLVQSLEAMEETGKRSAMSASLKPNSLLENIPAESRLTVDSNGQRFSQSTVVVGSSAIVAVEGVLETKETWMTRWGYGTAYSNLRSDIRRIIDDSEIETLYLYVDSPGGRAVGCTETADLIYEAGQSMETIAIADGLALSAGYFLASACKRIVATLSSLIGSVGSIIRPYEYSEALKMDGWSIEPIYFGQHKADGDPAVPLTPQARKSYQQQINTQGRQFVDSVAKYRDVTSEHVMENFGQGRSFVATEALQRGMIDEIGTFNLSSTKINTSQSQPATNSGGSSHQHSIGPSTVRVSTKSRNESPVPSVSAAVSGDSINKSEDPQMEFSPKAKSAMHFAGLSSSPDANDEQCLAALNAYCIGRCDVPSDEAGVLSLCTGAISNNQKLDSTESLQPTPAAVPSVAQSPGTQPAIQPTAPSPAAQQVPVSQSQNLDENDRMRMQRHDALSYALNLLSTSGFSISATEFNESLSSNQSTEEIISGWQSSANGAQQSDGRQLPSQVRVNGSSDDRFHNEAVNRLMEIGGFSTRVGDEDPGTSMRNWSGNDVIAESISRMGIQQARGDRWEDTFNSALALGQTPYLEQPTSFSAAPGSVNNPGSLSAVVGRVFNLVIDEGMVPQEQTYQRWTGRFPDFNNLDPTRIYALSEPRTLDRVIGKDEANEFKIQQELLGTLVVKGFQNFIGLTWEMSLANNIADFMERIAMMSRAIPNTEQELCMKVLFSNAAFSDSGNSFFHASRGNLFANGAGTNPGAAPSLPQAEVHENQMLNRRGVGTNARRIKVRPAVVLYATPQKLAVKQTYGDPTSFAEMIQKNADSALNDKRGKVDMVLEPEIADFDSTGRSWFTFANPKTHAAIGWGRLSGFGNGGRRTSLFNPRNHCWEFHLRHACGAAGKNPRYANKDEGGAA